MGKLTALKVLMHAPMGTSSFERGTTILSLFRAREVLREVSWMPIDPVCGVQVDPEDAVTATYEGQTYYFCSDDCRQEFREAPEDYAGEGFELVAEEEE